MSINAGTVVSYLELDTGRFTSGLRGAGVQLRQFADSSNSLSTRIGALGGAFKTVGSSLTKGLTVPLAGVGAIFAKFAGDFETSLNKVETIADTSIVPIKQIGDAVLALSDDVGIAATELNETLYQTISATGDTANALDYVEIASKAAKGGFTDTTTAVDGLTTVMNAYGIKGAVAMQSVSDQMLMAQNYGKTTFGEMSSSIGNVIPIASSLDVTTQDLFASIATLTKNGIGTSEAITGLKAAMSNIIKPSKQASELAAELGFEFNSAHLKSVGWARFLEEIKEKTGGNADQMATLFGSVEALNSVTVLATTGSKDFAGALDAMSDSAGATEKAFKTMDKGTKDSIEDTLNSFKNLGIEIGEILLPCINKVIEKIADWVQWFKNLDDSKKEMIVKVGMVVAAIGPLLLIIGQVITSITAIVGVVGPAITAITGLGAMFTAAGGGMAGFTAILAALGGPVTLAVVAIAGLTAAGVALYNHFKQDAIPEVQLFGEETSEATKKAVGAYMDLDEKAGQSLMNLKLTGQIVSEETKTTLVNNFQQMGQQIKGGIDKHFQESYGTMETFFLNSSALTEQEEAETLAKMQENNEKKKAETDAHVARINEIMTNASKEKRELRLSEQIEINGIQRLMKENAIVALSENELEAKAIMERMKQQADELTAQQAAEVVQNVTKQTNETIEQANKQYNETIKTIIKQRDETGAITAEQADKLIENAKRQRDETVKNAEDMHKKVVEEAKMQSGEHVDEVNWETGEILSKWEIFKIDVSEKWDQIKTDTINKVKEMKENTIDKYEEIKAQITEKAEKIREKTLNTFKEIRDWSKNTWKNITGYLISPVEAAWKGIDKWVSKIKSVVSSAISKLKNLIGLKKKSNTGGGSSFSVGGGSPPSGSGYATGTDNASRGWHWVGEEGPELMLFQGGEKVIDNRKSMAIAEESVVISNDMINSLENAARSLKMDGCNIKGLNININIDYDKLGRALADYIKPSITLNAENHFTPAESTPSQHMRYQERMLRELRFQY